MAAHQETSPTLQGEGQESSTEKQTEDMAAHQENSPTLHREGQESGTKEQTEVLNELHKESRNRFQKTGEICEMNCVIACLVCARRLKLQDVHLCYDHLARIIMHSEKDKKYLQCGAYLSLLVKKKHSRIKKGNRIQFTQ